MKNTLSFNRQESAGLRERLEDCLTTAFAGGEINSYLMADGAESLQHWLPLSPGKASVYPQLKLAYTVWLSMHFADRHAVIAKFQSLYNSLPAANGNSSITTFCALFLHEFAAMLADAMEWPE